MKQQEIFRMIGFLISCGAFVYGLYLFNEASQPCGSDGCLIHILYLVAVPLLLVSGTICYKTGKKIFRNQEQKK